MIDPVQATNKRIAHSFVLRTSPYVIGCVGLGNDSIRVLDLIVEPANEGL